ncbi:MAG: toprim domain-containing protein, partial [Planctomycetota bacterium]
NKWSIDDFCLAGLVKPRDDGSDYDALRHRLIFPICDSLGRPIAFGGRRLDEEDNPKYLNSPETALFHKSATLYGLHLAKKAIIDTRTAVLVEGYTDVIAAHQHGASNVVAALGTALTAQHVRELRRYCDRAILVMDGDDAGVKAADRALELFIAEGLDVAIAIIPDGQDPDELLKSDGGLEKWNALVDNATDALAFAFERLAGGIDAADSATARQRVISDFLGRIAACGFASAHPDRQKWILDRLYRLTERNQTALRREILEKTPASRAPGPPAAPPAAPAPIDHPPQPEPSDELSPFAHDDEAGEIDADDPFGGFEPASSLAPPPAWGKPHVVAEAEQTVVVGLIHEADRFGQTLPNGMSLDEALPPATFSDPAGRAVYQSVYDRLADGGRPTLADLLAEMANAGRMEHAAWLTAAELSVARRTDRKADREEEMFQADLRFLFERYADAQRRTEADPRARLAALRDSAMTANDGLRRHTAIARAPDTPG